MVTVLHRRAAPRAPGVRTADDQPLTRRDALTRLALVVGAALVAPVGARADAPPRASGDIAITVYKSRSCGCCTNWVRHMTAAGFAVHAIDTDDVEAVKTQMGIRSQFASCHTGVIGRYVVEGHVPADLVRRMLKERPDALGLAVPGMPVGSPGMEQGPAEHYDVLLLSRVGTARVFARR